MSEPIPEAPATPTAEPTPTEPPVAKSFTQDDVNALLAKQKRESFGDYGDLKAQATELAALKAAQQTEQERATEAARKAQEDAASARAEALRYKAAATHGISQDHFDLLGTGDEDAINTRAEALGSLLKTASEVEQLRVEVEALRAGRPAPITGRPIEALRPGATPTNAQTQDDVDYNALFGANG